MKQLPYSSNTLFSESLKQKAPLAERMRPKSLSEFVGQKHVVADNKLLSRAIRAGKLGSCIFYGPPGTGKTTLASILAENLNANIVKLNAVTSGVADAKAVIERAKQELEIYGKRTYLLLDECHRWSKAQSDSVLEGIEKGHIYFIGSTTENPYVAMTRAIVSRCMIFQFKSLSVDDILDGINRAVCNKEFGFGNQRIEFHESAKRLIAQKAAGDLRKALNAVEIAVLSTPPENGVITITSEIAGDSMQSKVLSIDADMHYDMLSAFCKSLRGCDATAAVYWARRMIDSGTDPLVIARRLIVHASEDVGLADSNALVVATSALQAYLQIGSPEGEIPLTHAVAYVANAPKSNAVVVAIQLAKEDVQKTENDAVPDHLKNHNYAGGEREAYKYPYDYADGKVKQQYLPNEIKDHNYFPSGDERKGHPCFW